MAWQSLGTVAPAVREWRSFSGAEPLQSGAAVFRVMPKNLGVGVIFRTYGLVRFRSVQDGEEIVTPARRVYPRPEPMILQADIPQELRGGGRLWFPQVKKEIYRNFIGSTNDGSWLLEVQHLVTDYLPPPEFIEIEEDLDNITDTLDFLY